MEKLKRVFEYVVRNTVGEVSSIQSQSSAYPFIELHSLQVCVGLFFFVICNEHALCTDRKRPHSSMPCIAPSNLQAPNLSQEHFYPFNILLDTYV